MRALSKIPKPGQDNVLRSLFAPGIAVAEARDLTQPFALYGAEHAYASRAQAKRRREFAAGRHCARTALAALGHDAQPIARGARGAPVWPDGVVGSITHTDAYAAAAVASRYDYAGVGLDATDIGRVTPRLWRAVLTQDEIAWLTTQPAQSQPLYATVMFSAKEAFFKCQYAITEAWLDFTAIAVGITTTHMLSLDYVAVPGALHALPPAQGGYRMDGDKVLTGVTIGRPRAL